MKYFILILTIGSILSKDVYQFSWEIFYSMNKKEITAKFCENKEKPVLKCNGQCYLAKQLRKAELQQEQKNQQNEPVRIKTFGETIWVIDQISSFSIVPADLQAVKQSIPSLSSEKWNYNCSSEIEHPPQG